MFLQFMHRQSILHEHGSFSLNFSLNYLQKTFIISSFMFSCSMISNLRCSFKAFVILQALRKKADSDFCSRNCLLSYFFILAYLVCPFSLTLMNFFYCRSVFPVRILCSSSGMCSS